MNLKKISAADGNKVIQGAKFKLHNDSLNQWYVWNTGSNQWTFTTDESKATEFSTNASGVINFTRLGAGTYTVKETQVPTGYFSFVKPSFTLKITDDGHVTITGKDQPGLTGTVNNADGKTTTPTAVVKNIDNITQLPQTGATTMAVMLVGAFAIILRLRRLPSPPREPGRRSGHRLIFPNRPRPRKRGAGEPGAGIVRPFLLSAARSRPSSKKYGTRI